MDFSLITEKQIEERYNSLSAKLREVIDSPTKLSQVQQICKRNNFDDERTLITQQLITLIFLGFISIDHFRQELIDNLHIDYRHASDIGNEVGEKIFSGVREQLEVAYNPLKFEENEILEDEAVENNIIDLRSSDQIIDLDSSLQQESSIQPGQFSTSPQPSPYKGEEASLESKTSNPEFNSEAPAIIHQELEVKPSAKIKNSLGGIFGMFKSQGAESNDQGAEKEIVTAQIVGGNGDASQKTDPDGSVEPEITKTEGPKFRVVHYSDYKTPLNPFGGEADQNPEKMFVPENKTIISEQLINPNITNKTGDSSLIVPPASIEIVAGKQNDSMTSPQPSPYKGEEASLESKTSNLEFSPEDEKPMEINLGDIDQQPTPNSKLESTTEQTINPAGKQAPNGASNLQQRDSLGVAPVVSIGITAGKQDDVFSHPERSEVPQSSTSKADQDGNSTSPQPSLYKGEETSFEPKAFSLESNSEEVPAIIHEELKDNKSALKKKSFFGGFFGMFKSQKPEARNQELGKGIITDKVVEGDKNPVIKDENEGVSKEIMESNSDNDSDLNNKVKMVVKQVDYSMDGPISNTQFPISNEIKEGEVSQIRQNDKSANLELNLVDLGKLDKLEVDENVIDLKDIPVSDNSVDLRDLD